jgi:hypothetical protein
MLETEFVFTLPCGLPDDQGNLHRDGMMRRATARDELEAMTHPQVRASEVYLSVHLFSRVITRLGALPAVTPAVIESLFATDFIYLQELYMQINGSGANLVETRCPTCGTHFMLDMNDGLTAE